VVLRITVPIPVASIKPGATYKDTASAALTAGHNYTLTLTSHDDNYAGDPTYTLFDDVTLN